MTIADLTKKTVLLALGAGLVLGVGGGAWFVAQRAVKPKAVEAEAKSAGETKKEVTVELEPFVVNLAGQGSGRYLRASLSLAMKDEPGKQRLKEFVPRIRDGLIMLFSAKTAEALLPPEGKSALRGEVLERINGATGEELVEAVYFREFLIQ